MRLKYIYQLFISHLSILVVAFLILSLVFTNLVENFVYRNKAEELTNYGENILHQFQRIPVGREQILGQYSSVLKARNITFILFDERGIVVYPVMGRIPEIEFDKREWQQIANGEKLVVKRDTRYDQDVSLVAVPYLQSGRFVGGILLLAPVSGTREMISEINRYLLYTVGIALTVTLLLSWILSKFHVRRIQGIRDATSMVSAGNYDVQLPSSEFDEIGELANDFNKMVSKLKSSMDEIESLENRRRQFMADVSHEMRTPLTTISGVIEGMRNKMISEQDKEKGISLVSKETKRLIRLVNENLDYEKIRSNQVKLNKEEIQLTELLEIIKETLLFQAEEKNNHILIDADETASVFADYDRLTQILINIAKNSIQFTSDGTITLRGHNNNDYSVIEIEDTGVGIRAEEIEAIWRRFYKADLSRKNNPYGAFGLGLSIVKQLVQLHDGEITVTSIEGEGTKFTIKIPLKHS
ncbi:HAMP domain-containing histidine kinase [Bacillus sp. DNRA2]|uniref:sensor histidine kinase n=1 Tax=Bacillus sp. DNRA2 TaxID=2723053 RepID=UPI00145CB016|nr:HAMP domain-containing sensor histidine kinase [Bacillus sp. DNRA2]NMD70494.1 HAMP domain-containing histidine kinase [Bacillus sp. DNRA2]